MKFVLEYQKLESVRWLGHLDVLRVFERALRRSGLPVAFSQGYNPRQRIAFASALGVGVTADAEPMTVELTTAAAPRDVRAALNGALPPGFRIAKCTMIADDEARRHLNGFDCGVMRIRCDCDAAVTNSEAHEAAVALMRCEAIPVVRETENKRREMDLRPLLMELEAAVGDPGQCDLMASIAIGQGGSARPAEIVAALAPTIPGLALRHAHRLRLTRLGQASGTDANAVKGGEN